MNRPDPQPGERYRHWKGNVYGILFISEPVERYELGASYGASVHTETGKAVLYYGSQHDGCLFPERLVHYRKDGDSQSYARPLGNFLAVLGDDDEGTYFYRFEQI